MEETPQHQAKASISLKGVEGADFLDFGISLEKQGVEALNAVREKNYQIVIDISGSMSGTIMEMTKKLVLELVTYIITSQPKSKVSLMTFNTDITYMKDLQLQAMPKVISTISSIVACGGTVFHITFDKLREVVSELSSPKEELVIIYLTDGQIQSGLDKDNLTNSFEFLQKSMMKFVQNVEVHALGMGDGHDPIILDKIVQLQTSSCSYQFIKNADEIEVAFKNIVDIINESFIEAYLSRTDGQLGRIPLYKGTFNSSKKVKSIVLVHQDLINSSKIKTNENQKLEEEIKKNTFELVVMLNYSERIVVPFEFKDKRLKQEQLQEKSETYRKFSQNMSFIDSSLKEVIGELKSYVNAHRSSLDKDTVVAFCQRIYAIEKKYKESILTVFQIEQSQKDKAKVKTEQLVIRIREAVELANKLCTSQITTVEIAVLNQLAYPTIQNRLFAKRLAQRKTASITQFNEYEKLKNQLAEKYINEQKQLKEDFKEIDQDIGTCFLSCMTPSEALLNTDCLCVTFSVTRSELAIVRPESLKIKAVQPSMISAKSFIDCVKFSLDISLENSGSFDKKEGQIVQGVMREVINAAMPLYINQQHWEMARLWLEPILGWVVTLDPLGYHHAQKRTVPFAIMNALAQQMMVVAVTDYSIGQFKQVEMTCKKILEEEEFDSAQLKIENSSGLPMKEEITKQLSQFIEEAEFRMPDSIMNIEIFVAKCWLAWQLNWIKIDNINKFFRGLIEEQFRRKITQATTPISAIRDLEELQYKSESQVTALIEGVIPSLLVIHFYKNLFEGSTPKEAVTQVSILSQEKATFKLLLIESVEQLKALTIQSFLHEKDRVRKNSLVLKEYFDPYEYPLKVFDQIVALKKKEDEDASFKFAEAMSAKTTTFKTGSFEFTAPYVNLSCAHKINTLAQTKDIKEADLLIRELVKLKTDKKWYLWVLISYNCVELACKLNIVKEQLGQFRKFTQYQRYILGKASILSSDEIDQLELP